MNLKQYYNKQVKIVSKSGKVFWGTVNDYFYPEDNDTGKESIAIDTLDGQTPSGGAYSEIYYFDDDGNPADEEEATRCVIRECDKNGNLLNEVWGTV